MVTFPERLDKNKIGFTFRKEERLCSKKIIDKLFAAGDSFLVFPLKVQYLNINLPVKYPLQVAFSVGKKIFRKAVKRNLLKRRMREAYRLNKYIITQDSCTSQLAVVFIYVGKEVVDYNLIASSMKKALNKLDKILSSTKTREKPET